MDYDLPLTTKRMIYQACVFSFLLHGAESLIASDQIQREDKMKRILFKLMIITRDLMAQNPGVSTGILRRNIKLMVAANEGESRLEHVKNLPHQCELLQDIPNSVDAKVWSLAMPNIHCIEVNIKCSYRYPSIQL